VKRLSGGLAGSSAVRSAEVGDTLRCREGMRRKTRARMPLLAAATAQATFLGR